MTACDESLVNDEDVTQDDELSSGFESSWKVKPSGNSWFLERGEILDLKDSFGPMLGAMTEEIVLEVLGFLGAKDLANMCCVSQGSLVYCSDDRFWRDIALQSWNADRPFRFRSSWKGSILHKNEKKQFRPTKSVCSDNLFRPWQYAVAELKSKWLRRQDVDVRDAGNLSVQEFIDQYERPCRPVLIKNALLKDWPVFSQWGSEVDSTRVYRPMMKNLEGSEVPFRVGPVDMRLCDFLDYSEYQKEESPLYLFDCKFVERIQDSMEKMSGKMWNSAQSGTSDYGEVLYKVPLYFRNTDTHPYRDLLENMGKRRPDYRWLIAGAAKSGSKWHIDPNFTHAWNGVVSGSKRWLMFPPGHTPPGVTPSEDGADVTQPVSLMEWFVNFYDVERAPVEFTAFAGDLVFVPKGWWHCVLNIEPCVAITQNYISSSNLHESLRMMRDSPHLVSGLSCDRKRSELYSEFRISLEENCPELIAEIEEKEERVKRRKIEADQDRNFSFSFF